MTKAIIRKIDTQGRISIPTKWRKEAMKGAREVVIVEHSDRLEIIPKKAVDLTEFFDSIEVDFPLGSDYHELKKRLRGAKI